jgi:transcriptional regulator with XRE-family HTH domain
VPGVTNADWIKQRRVKAGYTSQAALAKAMGVKRGAVGNWEVGGRPTMANAERLAVLLGVDRSEMLSRYYYPIGGGGDTMDLSPAFRATISQAVEQALEAQVSAIAALVVQALREEQLPPLPPGPESAGGPPRTPRGGSPR